MSLSLQGFSFADRLSEWTLLTQGPKSIVRIDIEWSADVHDLATALRNALRQLQDVQAPEAVIHLWTWHWTQDMLDILVQELPSLEHLKFQIIADGPMTDAFLRASLRMASNMRTLSAKSLQLVSDEFTFSFTGEQATWPWDELYIKHGDAAQLTKLPSPLTHTGGKPVVYFECLDLSNINAVSTPCLLLIVSVLSCGMP